MTSLPKRACSLPETNAAGKRIFLTGCKIYFKFSRHPTLLEVHLHELCTACARHSLLNSRRNRNKPEWNIVSQKKIQKAWVWVWVTHFRISLREEVFLATGRTTWQLGVTLGQNDSGQKQKKQAEKEDLGKILQTRLSKLCGFWKGKGNQVVRVIHVFQVV